LSGISNAITDDIVPLSIDQLDSTFETVKQYLQKFKA